jgi:beta-lactamase class A
MLPSRRALLTAAPAMAIAASTAAQAQSLGGLSGQIKDLFEALPGTKTLKILAPGTDGDAGFHVAIHPGQRIFVASAFKAYVLAALMKCLDSEDIVDKLKTTDVTLDANAFAFGSDIFNEPNVTGIVSLRTAAEAMIMHSDNTATNLVMAWLGVDTIRAFIAGFPARQTQIPDNTRAFGAYLFGLPDYKTASYDEVKAAAEQSTGLAHPFLNDVQTMASTAADFILLMSRTLPGGYFQHQETQNEYRRILALADGVFEAVPFGVTGFAKTGYADFPNQHARSNVGAMTFGGRWVYFASIINWDAAEGADPATVQQWQDALSTSLRLIHDCMTSQS